jgi:hypothetical protein
VQESNTQTRRLVERVGQLEAWRHEHLEDQQAREVELQQLKTALRDTTTAYETLRSRETETRSSVVKGVSDMRGSGVGNAAERGGSAQNDSVSSNEINKNNNNNRYLDNGDHNGDNDNNSSCSNGRNNSSVAHSAFAQACGRGGPLQELCVMLAVEYEPSDSDVKATLVKLCQKVRDGHVQVVFVLVCIRSHVCIHIYVIATSRPLW